MEIKQLYDSREFDVFFGNGWDNWVRVRYTPTCVEVVKSNMQPSQQTLEKVFFKIRKKYILPQAKVSNGPQKGT